MKFNGSIPEEFTCPTNPNYIKIIGPMIPLRVIDMDQYENFKNEYHQIKKELIIMNSPLVLEKRKSADE